MIDIDFIEFYLKKRYSKKLEDYFSVNKSVCSKWRNKSFPDRRLQEFFYREGTLDIIELLEKIYKFK
jgi:hypothetical protein